MMKILAISDQHGFLPEIPECDVLLIGGDICPDFMTQKFYTSRVKVDKGEQRQKAWLEREFKPWLESVPAEHIVGIAGNHDFVFEKSFLIPDLPWVYLRDSEVEVDGLRIYGTPWVPNLPFWAFHAKNDEAMKNVYADIPEGIDVLISHGPPKSYGDKVRGWAAKGSETDPHVGSIPLDEAILRVKPKAVICGHIHEGYGGYRHRALDDTYIYNVSIVDETY